MPATVVVRVPAKVNLRLGVGPLRPDGYHELHTVFHAVGLFDEVRVRPADRLSLTVTGTGDDQVPVDRRNLAWRAAEVLAEATGRQPTVAIDIFKTIPVAAGLAGGSADAAGALVACSQLWEVDADLPALAATLGSDVAFALLGGTAIGTGRGEQLDPVPAHPSLYWALAMANFGISTAAAYEQLDALRAAHVAPEPIGPPDALLAALAAGDPTGVGLVLANDLQPAAFAMRPELRRTYDLGLEAGALGAVVSGSGPTCAFLASDEEHAKHLAATLYIEGVCPYTVATTGAVPGAEVVH